MNAQLMPWARAMAIALVTGGLLSCQPRAQELEPEQGDWSFLIFGDHGYHLDWPSKNDYKKAVPTAQQWYDGHLSGYRAEAARQQPELRPAIEFSSKTGGYVLSSGLAPVAQAMHEACVSPSCRFAVMLGDNIYPSGADGKDDADRFEEILNRPLAGLGHGREEFLIYSVLGNHDWKTSRAGARAQLEYLENTAPFYMSGYSYRTPAVGDPGQVEIFAIDTQLLLATTSVYETIPDDDLYEIDEDALIEPSPWLDPVSDEERDMLQWLQRSLADSTASWKIVIGHHPLWSTSGGKNAQSTALRKLLLPVLCRHADVYLSGHEHTLEWHEYDCAQAISGSPATPLTQIVSGAAGKQRMLNAPFKESQAKADPALETLFAMGSTWGFAQSEVTADEMTIKFFSVDAEANVTPVFSRKLLNRRSP